MFFGGSLEQSVNTLMYESDIFFTNDELDRLSILIEMAT